MLDFFEIVLILFAVGIVVFQVFLSRNNKNWLGLLLPGACFIISILLPIYIYRTDPKASIFYDLTLSFMAVNIITILLMIIYFVFNKKNKL